MKQPNWTFCLRLLGRNPNKVEMDRLAEYLTQFADLLGRDNKPVFKQIKRASTGIQAYVPPHAQHLAHARLVGAKSGVDSKAVKSLQTITRMIAEDDMPGGELLDANNNVIYLFEPSKPVPTDSATIEQVGEVDGIVVGVTGADDTLHITLRDWASRDVRLVVRNLEVGQGLAQVFRAGMVRCFVHGKWRRTESGWVPESGSCVLDRYEILDVAPAGSVLEQLRAIPGNAWTDLADAQFEWEQLRGIH
jgi:hypothetical protein